MVTLQPMSAEAWQRWRAASIRAYAADKARVGAWLAEDAEAMSAAEFARLLPDGQATVGHEFRSIANEAGETVGALWFAPLGEAGRGTAFIYDIEIDEAFRGQGYGRGALVALEPLARQLGYDAIGLHVFGDNDVARNLYRSSGYVETDVTMRKMLG
jgi:ribosomal protein S18 acetylase RimI-like enzyme